MLVVVGISTNLEGFTVLALKPFTSAGSELEHEGEISHPFVNSLGECPMSPFVLSTDQHVAREMESKR